MTVRFEFH